MTSRSPAEKAALQSQIDQFYWFHSIDFGDGLVARGAKTLDYIKAESDVILGPLDLRGTTLLDVGAYNGFYSFDAKRRGAASVTATDSFVWNDPMERIRESFELARTLLKADIHAREIDPTEITKQALGTFDVVLYLGVFYHLIDPIACTRGVAECAGRLLIVETHVDALAIDRPAMIFYPGTELNNDPSNWWGPNPQLVYALLAQFGFARIFFRAHSIHGKRGVFYAFRTQADADALLAGPLPEQWHDLNDPAARARLFGDPSLV